MKDKLKYFPNDDKQNQSFCKLKLLVEKILQAKQDFAKVPKHSS